MFWFSMRAASGRRQFFVPDQGKWPGDKVRLQIAGQIASERSSPNGMSTETLSDRSSLGCALPRCFVTHHE